MLNVKPLERLRQLAQAFAELPWPHQFILALGISSYAAAAVMPAFFTHGFDFWGFYQAAQRIVTGHGAAIYQEFFTLDPATRPTVFGYTAPVALLYAPLGILPYRFAWPVFQIVSQGCLWAAWWLAAQEAHDREIREPAFWMAIGMAFFFPVYFSLLLGQCEVIIFFLLLAGMRLYRRGFWAFTGLAFAVSICLKFFLGFVLVYFLLTRRWRLFWACCAWLIILEALSLVFVPASVQIHFWRFAPAWTARIQPFPDNHAVSGFFTRLLTVNFYSHGLGFNNLAHFLQWIVSSAIVILYVFRIPRISRDVFGDGFSYTLITALLISPLTDSHHLVFLLFPFLFIGFLRQSGAGWRWFYAFFAAFVPISRYLSFENGWRLIVFSLPFLALVALWMYLPAACGPGLSIDQLELN